MKKLFIKVIETAMVLMTVKLFIAIQVASILRSLVCYNYTGMQAVGLRKQAFTADP
jgi:hypothetical protein